MIDPELQDLLPLYLTEGRRRLEHLLEMASGDGAPAVAAEARRELHTLKGSSRMLKLRYIAELCHQGENLLQKPGNETPAAITSLLDRLGLFLDELAMTNGSEGKTAEAPAAGPVSPETSLRPGTSVTERRGDKSELFEAEAEIRTQYVISAEATDQLTGSMSSIRLLALSGVNASHRLGELAQLAESGVTDSTPRQVLAMLATQLRRAAGELEAGQHRLRRHAEDQLNRLLDLQLQPLRPFLQSLARHARELAQTLGKEIEVELEGGEARLDQRIVNELRGAFLHLVTNAVDHGIETPERRRKIGKPAAGRLKITAASFGVRVEITVEDDGEGVDAARVLEAAREAGLVSDTATDLSDAEALQLLFSTGFSTRREVSEVSGRGVGLDVVATVVRQLGGDVWMHSESGAGSQIFVEVPAARRGERVLVVRSGHERLALPKSAVAWVRVVVDGDLVKSSGDGMLSHVDGRSVRVVSLPEILGAEPCEVPVLIAIEVAGALRVLAVEAVEGEEEVLMRPFGRSVPVPTLFHGMALLTSGEPVAVLSPRVLVSQVLADPAARRPAPSPRHLHVLLVEDSLVTREMERRMLEEEGFLVTVTADAEEAIDRLAEATFDCLVTDLEMPGMNGFELTRHVRRTQRLGQLPIIVVSTRDQPADRIAGLEAGADAYISKQRLEPQRLAGMIRRLGSRG